MFASAIQPEKIKMRSSLRLLVQKTIELILNGLHNGKLITNTRSYFLITIERESFKLGVNQLNWKTSVQNRTDLSRVHRCILPELEKSEEYCQVIKLLDNWHQCKNSNKDPVIFIDRFLSRVVSKYLEKQSIEESYIEAEITFLQKEIANEPFLYEIYSQLDGLIMYADKLVLDINNAKITLRAVEPEDIEQELPISMLSFPHGINSQALSILEVKKETNNPNDASVEVEKMITLFRLFKVGSVRYIQSKIFTNPYSMYQGSILNSAPDRHSVITYSIENQDIENIKAFLRSVYSVLPGNLYDAPSSSKDYLAIAYDRYLDALLHREIIEKRIASTVMGLESLLARENQEIAYRLGKRLSKVLGIIGFEPLAVNRLLKEAYNIRSKYVHGEHLGGKEQQKLLQRLAPILSVQELLHVLLNYLRVLILIMVFTATTDKNQLIELIDDALIAPSRNEELNKILSAIPKSVIN